MRIFVLLASVLMLIICWQSTVLASDLSSPTSTDGCGCQNSDGISSDSAHTVTVTQGERVTLNLKLVNVGYVSLSHVTAQFNPQATPAWLYCEDYGAMAMDIPALTPQNPRPIALLPFTFTVDRDAPVGESQTIALQIREGSGRERPLSAFLGALWTKSIKIKVLPHPKPQAFELGQNFPNPFNPETWIPFQLKEASDVTIRIFDSSGRLVRTLSLGSKEADFYVTRERAAYWNGSNDAGERVASGIYFYHLQAGQFSAVRKLMVIK